MAHPQVITHVGIKPGCCGGEDVGRKWHGRQFYCTRVRGETKMVLFIMILVFASRCFVSMGLGMSARTNSHRH
jgi:hypothetical protein